DGVRLASARAGNVIGGGDWGEDRLVPDIMRAALAGEEVRVRNPNSLRPWQHVLNPLSGYLVLAQALWGGPENAGGWNFGPSDEDAMPVGAIVERLAELWPSQLRWTLDEGPHPHEARYLKLDSSRARRQLGWQPLVSLEAANSMEPFFPLRALVCGECFLVQLEEFETPEAIFSDYAYFSSYSSSWIAHSRRYSEQMVERLALDESSHVVEIASNDGYLLQFFHERQIPVLGIEPAANVAKVALQKGIP